MAQKDKKKPEKKIPDSRQLSQVSTSELESIVFGGADDEDEHVEDVAKTQDEPADAWADPDDAALEVPLVRGRHKKRLRGEAETQVNGNEYERILRQRFKEVNGVARWTDTQPAAEEASDSEEEEDAVATSTLPVAAGGALKPTEIEIKRAKELPMLVAGQKKGPSAIEALQFHPSSELLLTGGRDKTLRLFAVDGEENEKVASYFFRSFPILCASFTPTGDQVLLTSSNSQMWGLDVSSGEAFEVRNISSGGHEAHRCLAMGPSPSRVSGLKSSQLYGVLGDAGAVKICDLKTKHPIRTFRMSSDGAALVFAPRQDLIYSADAECNIYEWDLSTGRCRQKVKEPWATRILNLAVAPGHMAVGTATGNVDILDLSGPKLLGKPMHSIDNLTTRADLVRYNHQDEILAVGSRVKADALKLIHVATGTVFQNWPTARTPLKNVSAVDFSRQGMMAIGNQHGRVLIYRLTHYA